MQTDFSIYPNPADKQVHINTSAINFRMHLFDLTGREVLQSTEKDIDISTLEKGIYFLQLQTNNGTCTKQIIVE